MIKRFPPKIRIFRYKRGFTLIEILIVIALVALVMSIAVPNATLALKMNISNSGRQLATTIRSSYDDAVLKGLMHRLVFDIDHGEYWVEIGEKDYLILTPEQQEEENRKAARRSKEDIEKHKDPFTMDRNITKNKIKLPHGVHFTDIITSHTRDPQKGGIAVAYVFPHGFVEKLIIHLKDDYDRDYTLIVNSVNGKSRQFERYVQETN